MRKLQIQIEYCAEWGYEGHAARVAEEILSEHADHLQAVVIVPSSGGRFVVQAGEKHLFNKAEAGRFPREGEVAEALARLI